MPKYHIWPHSGERHRVDEKHILPNGDKVHGEETGSIEYRYPKGKYKEGK